MAGQIFQRASRLFQQGDVPAAYALYLQAAATFGRHVVAHELRRCEAALDDARHRRRRPSVALVLTSSMTLRAFPLAGSQAARPYDLRLYFHGVDGMRPLHDAQLLERPCNELLTLPDEVVIPEADYVLTLDPNDTFTEDSVVGHIEFASGKRSRDPSPFRPLRYVPLGLVRGRVSIIIPTCGRPENLELALASVIGQDYPDKEIIVVDDSGSQGPQNGQTREVVARAQRTPGGGVIRLIEHQYNRNGAAARNTGLMHATGEFICFLDDDDVYLPGRIGKCVAKLDGAPDPYGAVYCGYLGWNSQENNLARYPKGDLTRELLLLDYEKHYLHTDTATYRREAVDTLNGFDETYPRHQDLEFNLRFFQSHLMDAVQEPLVRLSPKDSLVNNRLDGQALILLKHKFLQRFAAIISGYPAHVACEIFLRHLHEAGQKYHGGA